MFSATGISPHQFLVFTLVLARVLPLLWVAPVLGSSEVPARVRVLLAVALAAVVTPLELTKTVEPPHTLIAWLLALGAEAIVGLSLGLGILVLFSGMQLAGQAISQMSGMQLADVFDPGFETSQPVFSKLLFLVSLAVFVAIGGHQKTMEALLDTFAWLPAGQGGVSRSFTDAVTSLLSQSFALGVRAVAPAMVALVLATLVLALVSRTLPQLNLLVLGFGFNVLTTLAMLAISLGTAAWVFQDQIEPAWTTMLDGLRPR